MPPEPSSIPATGLALVLIARAEALIAAGTRRCEASRELTTRSRTRVDSARVTCVGSRERLERSRFLGAVLPEPIDEVPLDNVIALQLAPRGRDLGRRDGIPGPLEALLWELGPEKVRSLAKAALDAVEGLDAVALLEELTKLRRWVNPTES